MAITMVLFLAPGPIVTLVIWTAATRGVRAGLVTVAGSTAGTALLLAAIVLGLSWVLGHAAALFEALRWPGAAYPCGSACRPAAPRRPAVRSPGRPGAFAARFPGRDLEPQDDRVLQRVPAAIPRPAPARAPAARRDVGGNGGRSGAERLRWAVASGLGHAWFMHPGRAKLLGRAAGVTLIGGAIWLSLARLRPS